MREGDHREKRAKGNKMMKYCIGLMLGVFLFFGTSFEVQGGGFLYIGTSFSDVKLKRNLSVKEASRSIYFEGVDKFEEKRVLGFFTGGHYYVMSNKIFSAGAYGEYKKLGKVARWLDLENASSAANGELYNETGSEKASMRINLQEGELTTLGVGGIVDVGAWVFGGGAVSFYGKFGYQYTTLRLKEHSLKWKGAITSRTVKPDGTTFLTSGVRNIAESSASILRIAIAGGVTLYSKGGMVAFLEYGGLQIPVPANKESDKSLGELKKIEGWITIISLGVGYKF